METAQAAPPAGPAAADGQETMRAIVQSRYGTVPEDVMRLERIARPVPARGEVLVRVRAAGVDRGTWHLMAGQPYLMRLGFGFRGPRSRVPGIDVAGTVVATGPEVTRFAPGDEVFGVARGSFAEYAAAREDKLAGKPAALSFAQAAAFAVSGLTALQGLRDAGRIQPGHKVLVIGASGGVGSYAVQLAKVFGAEVTGVCRTAKTELVRALGADHVIDYTQADYTRADYTRADYTRADYTRADYTQAGFAGGRQPYDLIFDIGGNTKLSRLRRVLAPRGTLVIVGGEGGRWTGIGRQLRALALSPLVRPRLTMLISRPRPADLDTLRQLAESGQVTPVIDGTVPLAEAAQAIRRLQAGQVRGKLAITI